jgi:hypothetical protein
MPLFHSISQIGIETSTFICSNFAWGLHDGVDVMWSGGLLVFWSCIDVIVVRFKLSRGIKPFSPMEIDSANISHPPNGEICMDKSHLLPNNQPGSSSMLHLLPIETAPYISLNSTFLHFSISCLLLGPLFIRLRYLLENNAFRLVFLILIQYWYTRNQQHFMNIICTGFHAF